MEVVLLENIKNLGQIGDIVNIKRGYGRNFLIKYGKALKASKENIVFVNKKKTELNAKNLELKKGAKKIYDIVNNTKNGRYERFMIEAFGGRRAKEVTDKEINKKLFKIIEIKDSEL